MATLGADILLISASFKLERLWLVDPFMVTTVRPDSAQSVVMIDKWAPIRPSFSSVFGHLCRVSEKSLTGC